MSIIICDAIVNAHVTHFSHNVKYTNKSDQLPDKAETVSLSVCVTNQENVLNRFARPDIHIPIRFIRSENEPTILWKLSITAVLTTPAKFIVSSLMLDINAVNACTLSFNGSNKGHHNLSWSLLIASIILLTAHWNVPLCLSIRFSNLHHSQLILLNASSTSLNHTFPLSTICFTATSVVLNIFASSDNNGTPAFINCLNSEPYSWFADLTCPYAYAICWIGTDKPADTSHKDFNVGIIFSASIPYANNCFAVCLIPVSSNGVFAAKSDKSSNISFALSALHSIVSNATVACSRLPAIVTIQDANSYNFSTAKSPATAEPIFQNDTAIFDAEPAVFFSNAFTWELNFSSSWLALFCASSMSLNLRSSAITFS